MHYHTLRSPPHTHILQITCIHAHVHSNLSTHTVFNPLAYKHTHISACNACTHTFQSVTRMWHSTSCLFLAVYTAWPGPGLLSELQQFLNTLPVYTFSSLKMFSYPSCLCSQLQSHSHQIILFSTATGIFLKLNSTGSLFCLNKTSLTTSLLPITDPSMMHKAFHDLTCPNNSAVFLPLIFTYPFIKQILAKCLLCTGLWPGYILFETQALAGLMKCGSLKAPSRLQATGLCSLVPFDW